MPKLSVVSIAKTREELDKLENDLSNQTYQDYEFVGSTEGTIPEAWNDAISKAEGDFLVFTETDARPINDRWLEDIAKNLRHNFIVKGTEIRPMDLNMCNLVADAKIFKKERFDESFPVCEDTELFARLRKNNIPIEKVDGFPVVHVPTISWKKTLSRAFTYGHLFMKIVYRHGLGNIETVSTKRENKDQIHPVSNRVRIICENVLILAGLVFGVFFHFFERIKK
jgi:hypothetical protein